MKHLWKCKDCGKPSDLKNEACACGISPVINAFHDKLNCKACLIPFGDRLDDEGFTDSAVDYLVNKERKHHEM